MPSPELKPIDCLCTGIVVADHVCAPVDHLPRAGELVLTEGTSLNIGGCAANVAVDLSRLSRRTAVVGCVGDDSFGRFIADELRGAGIDPGYLRILSGESTSCSMIVNVAGDDRRFIHARGANGRLTGGEITEEMLANSRAVYVGGYCLSDLPSPENIERLFRAARQLRVHTVLDVVVPAKGDYSRFLAPVLPWTDVFMPNRDEGELLTGQGDPVEQAKTFRAAGAKTVVITCGQSGSILLGESGGYRLGGFATTFVDGTGSGDAFAAGFIHGLLQDAEIIDCARIGSALGASCVRATGATTGVFREGELADFLAANSLDVTRFD